MGIVQRAAVGLLDLLSIKDVSQLPTGLQREIYPTLDLTQFLATSQIQILTGANAALAENGLISIVPGGPAIAPGGGAPFILFGISSVVVKTATMTACQISYSIGQDINTAVTVFNSGSFTPFGATETGAVSHGWYAPYPRICPVNTNINLKLDILGTDATANCSVTAMVGRLI